MSSNGSGIKLSRQCNQKHMYALIEEYQSGEVSRQSLCEREKITLAKFSWWLSKYRKEKKGTSTSKSSSPPSFIEVKPSRLTAGKNFRLSDIEIIYPGEVRLRIHKEIDFVTLQSLLTLGRSL